MSDETSNRIIGIIFIFVIILLAGIGVLYFHIIPNDVFVKKIKVELQYQDMQIVCPEDSYFVLQYKKQDISSGQMNDDSIDIIKNLVTSWDYDLFCWGNSTNGYYLSSKTCFNTTKCILDLEKQGTIETKITKYNDHLVYDFIVSDGVIHNPILCVSWSNLYNFDSSLTETAIPSRFRNTIDKCYDLDYVKNSEFSTTFFFDKIDKDSSIRFTLIDYCNMGLFESYSNCGIPDKIDEVDLD